MIKNPSYGTKVLVEKTKEKSTRTGTANPNAVSNVNAKQGPRRGNADARPGKRSEFVAAKQDRAPVADAIERAYGARAQQDSVSKKLEPVASNVKGKKFS